MWSLSQGGNGISSATRAKLGEKKKKAVITRFFLFTRYHTHDYKCVLLFILWSLMLICFFFFGRTDERTVGDRESPKISKSSQGTIWI